MSKAVETCKSMLEMRKIAYISGKLGIHQVIVAYEPDNTVKTPSYRYKYAYYFTEDGEKIVDYQPISHIIEDELITNLEELFEILSEE